MEANRAVAPRRVIEGLDIIEDRKFSFSPRGRLGLYEAGFGFKRAPKRFHGGVIVAIAGAAHTTFTTSVGENVEVLRIDILTTAVGVMD
jgi:hypothetical protein